MNKLISALLLLLLLCAQQFDGLAQQTKLKKADKHFSNLQYKDAIKLYLEIANSGFQDSSKEHVSSKLAYSYFFVNDPINAEKWFKQALESNTKDPKMYYYYAQVLRSNQKYSESSEWMNNYLQSNPGDQTALKQLAEFKDFDKLFADSAKVTIRYMDNLNSEKSDFSPSYYKNKLIYVSARDTGSSRRNPWTNEPFFSLYEYEMDTAKNLFHNQKLGGDINSKYHQGPVCYDKNTGFLYFTRNNYINGKKGISKDNTTYLKIFRASYREGKWSDIVELPFNNNEYSCAHPALTPDGKRIYFISNMPGGLGGTDIYYADKLDSGWSKPKNAGEPINTAGNELFPSFSDYGILYFASNGHPGIGGLDIFTYSNGKVKNMGYPVNSSFDDFGIATHTGSQGYFSSNRKKGTGNDDIYSFLISPPVRLGKLVRGKVMAPDSTRLANVKVRLLDEQNIQLDSFITDTDGKYEFDASPNQIYVLEASKASYVTSQDIADTHTKSDCITLDFILSHESKFSLYCRITDKRTGKPLDSVEITLQDNFTKKFELIKTQRSGDFYRSIEDKQLNDSISYKISIEKRGYLTKIQNYKHKLDHEGQYNMHEELNFNMDPIEKGLDLSETIGIKIIYFDTGKDEIRPDAAIELDKIVQVMNDNPKLEIELGAHSDCRGSDKINLELSERRAISSANYVKSRIENPERIYGKGFGKSQPKIRCECDGEIRETPCTEEDHQKNRRTEFRVVQF